MFKWLVWKFASRYVAGTTREEVLVAAANLNQLGYAATISLLGEDSSEEQATHDCEEYSKILTRIHERKLDCNISVKFTHLGESNIRMLSGLAEDYANSVCLDMESCNDKAAILKLYHSLKPQKCVSTVLQSKIKDSLTDVVDVENVRICKGIYKESKEVSFNGPETNSNFMSLVTHCRGKNKYVSVATHDLDIIYMCRNLLKGYDRCEFQFLHGVPMGDLPEQLKEDFKVRFYLPYGENWYPYCMRRAKENPHLVKNVISNLWR
jgi:proline dehydrogenase